MHQASSPVCLLLQGPWPNADFRRAGKMECSGLTCDRDLSLLNALQPTAVQVAPVIFYGTLLPDERMRWVCLLDWNCIKEKARRKESGPGCRWSENCSMAAWHEQMKGLISFDNTQQWVMTPKPPTPSCVFFFCCFTCNFFSPPWSMALFAVQPLLHSTLFAFIVCAAAGCLPSVCA